MTPFQSDMITDLWTDLVMVLWVLEFSPWKAPFGSKCDYGGGVNQRGPLSLEHLGGPTMKNAPS